MKKIHNHLDKYSILYFFLSFIIFVTSFIFDLYFVYRNILYIYTYISYVVSFFFLIILIYTLILNINKLRGFSLKESNIPLMKKLSDYHFRTSLFSTASLILNILLSLFHFFLYSFYHSSFQLVIGEYLILLAIIRLFIIIIYYKYKHTRIYKYISSITGINIILLNLLLIYIIYKLSVNEEIISYHPYISYLFAFYAFTKLTLGIINFVKSHRKKEKITICLRNLNIIDSLVTLMSLTNCLINLNNNDFQEGIIITSILAFAIIIFSTSLGIMMIIKERISHGKI